MHGEAAPRGGPFPGATRPPRISSQHRVSGPQLRSRSFPHQFLPGQRHFQQRYPVVCLLVRRPTARRGGLPAVRRTRLHNVRPNARALAAAHRNNARQTRAYPGPNSTSGRARLRRIPTAAAGIRAITSTDHAMASRSAPGSRRRRCAARPRCRRVEWPQAWIQMATEIPDRPRLPHPSGRRHHSERVRRHGLLTSAHARTTACPFGPPAGRLPSGDPGEHAPEGTTEPRDPAPGAYPDRCDQIFIPHALRRCGGDVQDFRGRCGTGR